MLDISGVRIDLSQLDGTDHQELRACRRAVAKKLGIVPADISHLERRKRSIDARRDQVHLTMTLRVALTGGPQAEQKLLTRLAKKHRDKGIKLASDVTFSLPSHLIHTGNRPVIVGAGCAGLFCALTLARAGLTPLLLERGDSAHRRAELIAHHNATGELDPESNIQFGVGGAGTFSDGKLYTGTKSPAHRLILEELVVAGAPRTILWDAHPHIGSDILETVVDRLITTIREAGGEVRLRCRMTDLTIEQGRVAGLTLINEQGEEERVATDCVVLSCGHSARDVFELLKDRGVALERKPFAMGVRIEHTQAAIDKALYGKAAGHPALGAAPYRLAVHLPSGRGAFSFCMCPGGLVVSAASEPEGVCTNGMSLSARDGANANAGLLCAVEPQDLSGDDVLAGVALQRQCERAAYAAGGGSFVAPAQLVGDFLSNTPSSDQGSVTPTYPRGVAWGRIDNCLPEHITQTLREALPLLGRRLRGYDAADTVLTGVETRSSSPVRVVRSKDGQSISTAGLWPVGEGAGYAGGIMSAATDGMVAATKIAAALTPKTAASLPTNSLNVISSCV